MFIFNSQVVSYSLSILKESILRPLSIQLTAQEKRIALIATAIFAYMTTCFLFYYFFCRDKEIAKNHLLVEREVVIGKSKALTHVFASTLKGSEKHVAKKIEVEKKAGLEAKKNEAIINAQSDTDRNFNDDDSIELINHKKSEDDKFYHDNDSTELINYQESEDDKFSHDDDSTELINYQESEDDEFYTEESDKTGTYQEPKFSNINGKFISFRTQKCLAKLTTELALLGKVCGEAIDNGDCFWDAFAQGLSIILNRPVTLGELRQKVSKEVKRLDKGPDETNWVKTMMKKNFMDTYEDYRDKVAYSCNEALQNNYNPTWGEENRDGVILCHLYKVNLKVYSVGCMDEDLSQMNNPKNFYFGDEDEYPTGLPYQKTVEVALYPGHFLPVRDTK